MNQEQPVSAAACDCEPNRCDEGSFEARAGAMGAMDEALAAACCSEGC